MLATGELGGTRTCIVLPASCRSTLEQTYRARSGVPPLSYGEPDQEYGKVRFSVG